MATATRQHLEERFAEERSLDRLLALYAEVAARC
jgi:hypothetical protein